LALPPVSQIHVKMGAVVCSWTMEDSSATVRVHMMVKGVKKVSRGVFHILC